MQCSNCGYPPANPDSTICPYCHARLSGERKHEPTIVNDEFDSMTYEQAMADQQGYVDIFGGWQPEAPQQEETGEDQPAEKPDAHTDTVVPEQPGADAPLEAPAKAPAFELRPMVSPLMPCAPQGIAFEGESVVLSGQNLMSPMMDQSCQAVVTRDADGQWTIANGSQNKSTYMLVDRPLALRDGDVILLGGNLYVFHPNEQQ